MSQARGPWDLLLYTMLKGIIIFKVADISVCKVSLGGAYFLDMHVTFDGQVGKQALRDSEYGDSALALGSEPPPVVC